MAIRTLSLCSGYEGIGLGLKLALGNAITTVCYVEREAYCASLIVERIQEKALPDAPIWSDLKTFDPKPWHGKVDLITGGYPCQPFSLAGQRKGTEDPRHLWPFIKDHIREIQPAACFFENVAGHLSLGFDQVRRDLEDLGYEVAAGLFTAEEVGASHKRERLFILAYRADAGLSVARLAWERKLRQEGGGGNKSTRQGDELDNSAGPRCGSGGCQEDRKIRGQDSGGKGSDGRRNGIPNSVVGVGQADSDNQGLQERAGLSGDNGQECKAPERGSLPLFAPGPGELTIWEEILKDYPELEPAICRVADGPTFRVDRIRALGNGVVPDVAAYAFIVLLHSLAEAPQCG